MPQDKPYDHETAQAEFLLLKRLSQPLSEEEQEELDILLKNPEIQNLEQEILSNNNAGIYDGGRDPAYLDFNNKIKKKRTFNILLYTVAAVGMLLLVTKIMNFWVTPEKAVIQNLSSKVTLQLPDENTVALDKPGEVMVDKKKLRIQDSVLDLSGQELSSSALSTLNVPKGRTYKVVLDDGSVVSLNSASQLKFPLKFTPASREVYLNGEAYFTVAKDATRPFLVHLNDGTSIKVLGTEFNVNTYTDHIVKTSLVSGAVQVNNNRDAVVLKPNEEYIYDGHAGHIQALDSRATLSWLKGVYFFNSTSFEDISQVLDRNFDRKIVFKDSTIAQRTYSGIIDKSTEFEGFLKSLQASASFTYSIDHNTVFISK